LEGLRADLWGQRYDLEHATRGSAMQMVAAVTRGVAGTVPWGLDVILAW